MRFEFLCASEQTGARISTSSEMIGDGILTLAESGAVTNRRKNYLPGKMNATFTLASKHTRLFAPN